MKVIMMIATIAVGTGAAVLLLTRSTERKKRRRPMTFRELYEDSCYDGGNLFE